jgi:hypothetical protein
VKQTQHGLPPVLDTAKGPWSGAVLTAPNASSSQTIVQAMKKIKGLKNKVGKKK